jgi:AhpD family alkylhydroperoxidase
MWGSGELDPLTLQWRLEMQARMKNPAMVLSDALQALFALNKAIEDAGVPYAILKMVHLRASQINGCSVCVDMHARELKKAGESDDRVHAVSAWYDAPYFSDAERAALALTEAATRINDRSDPVPDAIWNDAAKHFDERSLSALLLAIGVINVWNRLNVSTRQVAGQWRG